ncbi:membrane protein [soil metagenome]
MNDGTGQMTTTQVINQDRSPDPGQETAKLTTLTHIMYALHTASWFSAGFFSVIAMILNYVKRDDLHSPFFASHFRWQARSFWFTLLWLVVTSPLWLFFFFPGAAAWTLIGIWYLYRYIRGWWAFAEGRSMPVPV